MSKIEEGVKKLKEQLEELQFNGKYKEKIYVNE